MRGTITTYQRCPKCKGTFQYVDEKLGFICSSCLTRPTRYRITICEQGNTYRISKDIRGRILDSYERAYELLTKMRSAIDEGIFSIHDYILKEIEQFHGKNLIPKWLQMKVQQNLSPLHLHEVNKCINRFLMPFFENIDCRDIRTYHIEDFFMKLPSHWSDKTKKNVMTNLHSFVTWLFRREILARIPSFPVISPAEPPIKWIDRETQFKIISPMPKHLRDIHMFMFYHPVRIQEACALKVKDINISNHIVHICRAFSKNELRSRKNKKPYYLPLSSEFNFDLLKNKLPEAFVFTNRYGMPHKPNSLRKNWNKYAKKAGVDINLYCATRHSGASQAINKGVGLDIISKALGHSSVQVTTRYASMDINRLKIVTEG